MWGPHDRGSGTQVFDGVTSGEPRTLTGRPRPMLFNQPSGNRDERFQNSAAGIRRGRAAHTGGELVGVSVVCGTVIRTHDEVFMLEMFL
jgi:hypothetical protein